MATSIETVGSITIKGVEVETRPLKIKHLRKFMKRFEDLAEAGKTKTVKDAKGNETEVEGEESLDVLLDCVVIAMEQYNKEFANKELLEEELDLPAIYTVFESAAGIVMGGDSGN